jgi:hypothetical protein
MSPKATEEVTATAGSASSRFNSGSGFGVVVISWRGRRPSLSPNCSMSKQASMFFHFANSSSQAASNCGPRRLSGSSEENICATAPLSHTSRRRVASKRGRQLREIVRMPDGPVDHHLAHIGKRLADQRDAAVPPSGEGLEAAHKAVHPFRAEPRLAGAAPAHNQPGGRVSEPQRILRRPGVTDPLRQRFLNPPPPDILHEPAILHVPQRVQ